MKHGMRAWERLLGSDTVSRLDDASTSAAAALGIDTPVVSPPDLEAVQESLRFASAENLRVLPAGSLQHVAWGAPLDDVDVVLSSRRLDRIVDYEPDDLTLSAQAGVPLARIDAEAKEHQQRLAADPFAAGAATLGGACAANRSGLCRLRYGTLRDAVLGARVVHADGSTTRTGGRVVKNVTGYDLAKLYVGSQGALVFLVELHLRLVTRPPATALVHAQLPFEEARRRVWDVHRSALRPVAIVVSDRFDDDEPTSVSHNEVHVLVRFEGRGLVVDQQAGACKKLLGGRVVPAARTPWEALRQFSEPRDAAPLVQVSAVPTSVFDVIANARESFDPGVSFVGLFGVGLTWLRSLDVDAQAVQALHERFPATWTTRMIGDTATLCCGAPRAAALQDALKSAYDPQRRLRALPSVAPQVYA